MPDILFRVSPWMYFYFRDDRRIGLHVSRDDGPDVTVDFDVEDLVEVVKAVALRYVRGGRV